MDLKPQISPNQARATYQAFIASIDESGSGRDQFGGLRWHVECSSETNAGDMATENKSARADLSDDEREALFWIDALETARMVADAWRDFFPELVKNPTR